MLWIFSCGVFCVIKHRPIDSLDTAARVVPKLAQVFEACCLILHASGLESLLLCLWHLHDHVTENWHSSDMIAVPHLDRLAQGCLLMTEERIPMAKLAQLLSEASQKK